MLKYWLWMAELPGLTNQARLAFLRHFGTPENAFYADAGEILLTEGVAREQAEAWPPPRKFSRTAAGWGCGS